MKKSIFSLLKLAVVSCGLVSLSSFAMSVNDGDSKPFECVDAKTLEVNSECFSSTIENNIVFKNSQTTVYQNATEVSDRALASVTFDRRTMTIRIVAHKDATIARLSTLRKD